MRKRDRAVGGKDGRPHPIDEKSFDETVSMLQNSVDAAKLGDKDKSGGFTLVSAL